MGDLAERLLEPRPIGLGVEPGAYRELGERELAPHRDIVEAKLEHRGQPLVGEPVAQAEIEDRARVRTQLGHVEGEEPGVGREALWLRSEA